MTKTLPQIIEQKTTPGPLVCLTAYSAPMAEILDPHCDILLVGDSLGMVIYGMENTLGVSLDMMIAHGKAVTSHAKNAFIMVDMPYGTYEDCPKTALQNARHLYEETGCHALKLEGGSELAATVQLLTEQNIPVVAHIGLQPQSVEKEGGYKIKGKTTEQQKDLITAAQDHERAGAIAILIEGTIEEAALAVANAVSLPTIGIGAGRHCDGQILVTDDALGLLSMAPPKFAKRYGDIRADITACVRSYADDVRNGSFPSEDHIYRPIKSSKRSRAS